MAACPSSMATIVLVACLPALCSALVSELKPKRAKAKVKAGCSAGDITSLALSQNKQNHLQADLMPKATAAFMSHNYTEFKQLAERMTPKYCQESDIMTAGAISYKAMAVCIEKSMGVSEGCSQCYPNYLQNMAGSSGLMEPSSCMKTCTKMSRDGSDCVTKVRNQALLAQCLTPEIKDTSLPCLECSKGHISELAKCYKFGVLQPDVQINGVIDVIKKVQPSAGAGIPNPMVEVQSHIATAQQDATITLRSQPAAAEVAEEAEADAELESEASTEKAEKADTSAVQSEEDAIEQEKIAKIWQHMLLSGFSPMGASMGR